METCEVLGLGVSTIDILSLVEHFPAGDEVQRAATLNLQGGGPVATAIVTLARLGAKTAMCDSLGEDWRGNLIRDEFLQFGVGIEHLHFHENHTSSTACVIVRQTDGERAIIYSPGSAPELDEHELPWDVIRSAKFIHLNGRHWTACLAAARFAKSSGVKVSFDGGTHRYHPQLHTLIPLCDICIVTQEFAVNFTGQRDLAAAAEAILRQGPTLVAVTAGLKGSWIFPAYSDPFHQPAYRMPSILDTTGCGDSYHGAFLFGLLNDYPLSDCAAMASAVAALNSQALGGRAALPTLTQVMGFMHENDMKGGR